MGKRVDRFAALFAIAPFGLPDFMPVLSFGYSLLIRGGAGVTVLARVDRSIVACRRQVHLQAAAFYPELTTDFVQRVEESRRQLAF
ncbi:MAG: hypothetical protein ABF868_10885 [Sporolactobacillus sp.]